MNISNKRGKNGFYSSYAECEKSRLKSKKHWTRYRKIYVRGK